jgi:glutathione S-transferase
MIGKSGIGSSFWLVKSPFHRRQVTVDLRGRQGQSRAPRTKPGLVLARAIVPQSGETGATGNRALGVAMLKTWGRNNSINVQKVMWAAAELGLANERIDVGGAFGGLDGDYGVLNANRRVPTIEDGGVVVWESNVCVRYLAARYGAGSLWPEDPATRAAADMWMDWQQTTLLADMTVVFWGLVRTPEAERNMAAIDAAAGRLAATWRILDDHLDGRSFVAGDRFTMGDIPVGAACYRYYQLAIERPRFGAIEAWYDRLQEREPYRSHVMLPLT